MPEEHTDKTKDTMKPLKHECGIVPVQPDKAHGHDQKEDGTQAFRLNQPCPATEIQHCCRLEGTGMACIQTEATPGGEASFHERALGANAIQEMFRPLQSAFKEYSEEQLSDPKSAGQHVPFTINYHTGRLRFLNNR